MIFDLDKFIAEAAPAEPFEFTFGGEEYTLPPRLDMRVASMLSKGQLAQSLELLLGADQWARMCASAQVFNDAALLALLEAYAAHTGSTVGESKASPSSSKRTVRPSKRTSSGTTKLR